MLDLGASAKALGADLIAQQDRRRDRRRRCSSRSAGTSPSRARCPTAAGSIGVDDDHATPAESCPRASRRHERRPRELGYPCPPLAHRGGRACTTSSTRAPVAPRRRPWATATVAAASCLDANAASTAAIVLGEQAPGWLAARGLPARLARLDGSVVRVARLARRRASGGVTAALLAANGSKTLWYLTRGSGAVTLVLLTVSMSLGIVGTFRWRSSLLPRFSVAALHRNLTLLAVVFLGVHVATSVADAYAPVGVKDAFIPFMSAYRPFWLGLGALAGDLLLALIVTSLLRVRLGLRAWRWTHWFAYACWPLALFHSLGTGSDPRAGWLQALAAVSVGVVLVSIAVRLARSRARPVASARRSRRRARGDAARRDLVRERPRRSRLGGEGRHARVAAASTSTVLTARDERRQPSSGYPRRFNATPGGHRRRGPGRERPRRRPPRQHAPRRHSRAAEARAPGRPARRRRGQHDGERGRLRRPRARRSTRGRSSR